MEVELRKSEVPALAELKDLCRHECTAERCADAVREFGWSLEHVPEDMKTPEMCRRALAASAELGYGHLALLHHIPFAEVCMEAIRDWYGEGRADLYEVASAIRPEVFDGKMADFLVAEDGRCLSLLPVHLQTPERAAKAVEVSGASALLSDRVKPGLKTPELWRLMEQMTGGKFTYGQMADFYGGKPMAVKCIEVPDGFLKDREVTFDRQKETFRIAPLSQRQEQKERQEPERNDAPKRRNGMKI